MAKDKIQQKSEHIDLEYMARFKGGLRSRVHIYGIDSEAGEIYGAYAYIGVSVGAGYEVSRPIKGQENEKGEVLGAILGFGGSTRTSLVVDGLTGKLPEDEDWERKLYKGLKKDGWNVIKVQNREHVKPAIQRHVELYSEQFNELVKRFENVFQRFINEHPDYAK